MQETIRTEFKHCTVLTIAHRLETIMDYDRVLVLNGGVVIEDDTPKALIATEGSQFGMMYEAHQQGRSLSSTNLQALA